MYVASVLANSSNNSEVICPSYQQTFAEQICKTGIYVLIILLSLVGNTLVIFTVYKNLHMRSVTNLFISNLAASDLLITFLGMPNMITQLYLYDKWIFGEFICKLVVFLQSVSVASSVLTLLVISKDRFVAIVFPFHPRMEFRTARIILGVIWVTALAVMAPLLYAMRVRTGNQGYDTCIENWAPAFDPATAPRDYTVVLFVSLYLIPLITMAVLYSVIARKLWNRKRLGEQVNTIDPAQSARKKVIKMLITIILVFAACWLPLYIYQFIVFFAFHRFRCFDYNYLFYFISLLLSHANSAINPFLYALFNGNYREGFLSACRCFAARKKQWRGARKYQHSNSTQDLDKEIESTQVSSFSVKGLLRIGTEKYSPRQPQTINSKEIGSRTNKGMNVTGIAFTPKTINQLESSGSTSRIVTMQFSNLSYNGDED